MRIYRFLDYHLSASTKFHVFFLVILFMLAMCSATQAFTVNVADQDGSPVSGFKWLLEQDNTHPPDPGVHKDVMSNVLDNTLSLSIHRSHAPVVASGESTTDEAVIDKTAAGVTPLPPGRYFISVLPFGDRTSCTSTYDMGGMPIDTNTQNAVTVYVRQNPIETAQISIKVFHDISPLNNAPDVTESGLAGFKVKISDQGGEVIADAFGNFLGTTYVEPIVDPCNPEILVEGSGVLVSDVNGEVFIKNIAPNKYAIQIVPPSGDEGWLQTNTIEGTKTIDAWIRPNEPPFLVEFGPPFWHVFYGFVKEMNTLPGGGSVISGRVLKGHLSRPPAIENNPGPPPEAEAVGERCIVGLNNLEQGIGEAVYVAKCEDGTGEFTIENVPAGTYQLVIWDISLLHIISFHTVISDGVNPIALGDINTPMWFGTQEHNVFFADTGIGMLEQNINLRFRDGTIYQAFATDLTGFVPFQAVFPFFHFLVAEVDFGRFKATGLRVTNDLGGPVDLGPDGEGKRNPAVDEQDGAVLTQAFQLFAGQNQKFEWFKDVYGPGENGGISGTVTYATTRAENDPRVAAVEPWEPGIPRVQINLYADLVCNSNGAFAVYPLCPEATPGGGIGDGFPDDQNSNTMVDFADVDNHPLGWADGTAFRGPEDVDQDDPLHTLVTDAAAVFELGDAVRIAHTDSWDDNPPSGCDPTGATPVEIHGAPVPIEQCAEGLRTWNQTVPGVFDGGYAFGGPAGEAELPPGNYIVEAATPPGYKVLKEEDRNVDFGVTAVPALLPPTCVGDDHTVPELFSFLTQADGTPLPGVDPLDEDNWAPFSHDPDGNYIAPQRPLCDRKKIFLNNGQNAAVEFHLFTDVPKAARAVGTITDDIANEIAPGKPQFTEKFTPPWISIAVFDYTGQQINHTYGDEFGAYNWMAPSTYAVDLPTPSGVAPKMHHFCLNYPFLLDGSEDARYRPQYSTTCYTFNFEAGRTTYLDTPVIRQAAFVGALQTTLDCEPPNSTPVIQFVDNLTTDQWGPLVAAGERLRIRSMGNELVRNPDFPGGTLGNPADPPTEPEFITRTHGFGGQDNEGTVCVEPDDGSPTFCFPQNDVNWTNVVINVDVTQQHIDNGLKAGQLVVTRSNGNSTQVGIHLTVDDGTVSVVRVGSTQTYTTIQEGIDAALEGNLIIIDPGTYRELPILYKKVALQGSGAGGTTIFASHFSSGPGFENPLVAWRAKIAELVEAGDLGLLPEQDPDMPNFFLKDGEGPGIFVSPPEKAFKGGGARIDGFSIAAADLGGAIYVNAYAEGLQISNNKLSGNAGNLGGGIRIGNPTVAAFALGGLAVETSPNNKIVIRHNQISQNGSLTVGGGIAIFDGAEKYKIADCNICGNLSRSGGGGIAHRGLSKKGKIEGNTIAFNEVFQGNQPGPGLGSIGGGGGGIEIAGDPAAAGGLTEGTGDVTIKGNLIQGNLSGSTDGGGIALRNVDGQKVWSVNVETNVIVNNVTGLGGGGISLMDATKVDIRRNTISHNDSAATSVNAGVGTGVTTPQPAGIVSRALSAGLAAETGLTFSDPNEFDKNILIENRSWFWNQNLAPDLQSADTAVPPVPFNWDLGVVGTTSPACLEPSEAALTALVYTNDPSGCDYAGNDNNVADSSVFVEPYFNDLTTAAAADEGGNFVQIYYTPLSVTGDYTDTVNGSGP